MNQQPDPKGLIAGGTIIIVMGLFLGVTWVATSELFALVPGILILVLGISMLGWGLVRRRATAPARQADAPAATPVAARAPEPSLRAERRRTLAEAEETLMDVARRRVPQSTELTYSFICGGNQSLIRAYYDVLRVGAPVYGGYASFFEADAAELSSRQAEARVGDVPFAGKKHVATTVTDVPAAADALAGITASGFAGHYVTLVTSGPSGTDWVDEAYLTLLDEAAKQGILLGAIMFRTRDEAAARFLTGSFRHLAGATAT